MNLEEFKKKLDLKYTFGMTRTDGASRRYHDSELNIGAETHTPRNVETQEWGKGKTAYYFEDDETEFISIEDLFSAFVEREKGKE